MLIYCRCIMPRLLVECALIFRHGESHKYHSSIRLKSNGQSIIYLNISDCTGVVAEPTDEKKVQRRVDGVSVSTTMLRQFQGYAMNRTDT